MINTLEKEVKNVSRVKQWVNLIIRMFFFVLNKFYIVYLSTQKTNMYYK